MHELIHSIANEINEFDDTLIALIKNTEVESVLKTRELEILEKLVWKFTRILLELNKEGKGK